LVKTTSTKMVTTETPRDQRQNYLEARKLKIDGFRFCLSWFLGVLVVNLWLLVPNMAEG